MHPILYLFLLSLAAVCGIMLLVWLWGTRIRNYSIVDVWWALNFGIIAVLVCFLAIGNPVRIAIVTAGGLLWSLRLGLHLGARVFSHLQEEEGRYKQLRKEWADNLHLKFFIFFQAQGISNAVLALPFFIIASNSDPVVSWIEYAGAVLWLASITGEGIADWQLKQFKKDPANKGKVCDKGLWYYSRHPNYFFQLMIWVSVLVLALPSPWGLLAVISPVSIGYLIFNVTGIPMTEEQSLRSKGEAYKKYQQTTSVFVPWRKKDV